MGGLFQRRDLDGYTDSLADYMPGGDLFASKSIQDSNFRKLLRGMAGELFRSNGLLIDYNCEILPDETNKFLSEWESAVGIPDDCFQGTGTNDERRRDILVKLASLGVQTAQDFVDVAAKFGIVVTVESGTVHGIFPYVFPIRFYASAQDARFTIVVNFTVAAASTFTYTFPILFGSSEIALLECLFRKLKPANCDIIFNQV